MPLAVQELSLTQAEAGGFMSAFFLGYLLTQIPGGMLADRFGVRKVIAGSLLLAGSFTLLFAWVPGYAAGILLRFSAGLGSGAILATAIKGVFDHFPPASRATAMGFFMTSLPAGLMLANLLSPRVAANFGWRASFLTAGALTLLALTLSLWLLPGTGSTVAGKNRRTVKQLTTLLRNRPLLITAGAGFFAMWATWGLLTWNNSFLHDGLHLSLEASGKITALFALGALIGQPLAGRLADRYAAKRRQVGMGILLGFASLLLVYVQVQSFGPLLFLAPFLGAAAFIFGPVLNTFISELVEPDQVGTAIGFCNAIWQAGSLISPVLAGTLLDHTDSYTGVFVMLSAGPFLSVLLLAGIKRQ